VTTPWATGASHIVPMSGTMADENHSAEETARKFEITREEQDAFAIESYRRAAAAWSAGAFTAEIAPVTIVDARKGNTVVTEDEEYKKIKVDKVAGLRPVFSKTGTVTAANASNLNDGASALILASQEKVTEYGLTPLARIICSYPPPSSAPSSPLTSL
jgi:acetyl-CoA C-acetyltransferase